MAIEFKLPELGENIESGDVVKVLVSVGDTIEQDQPILEIETDKAAIEVPSTVSGVVTEIHVAAGEKATVGQTIVTVNGKASREDTAIVENVESEIRPPAGVSTSPAEAEDIQDVSTATEEPTKIDEQPTASTPPSEVSSVESPRDDMLRGAAPAAPSVRRFAREIGVDISQVLGSGPGERVSIEDVKNYARQLQTDVGGPANSKEQTAPPQLPDFSKWGAIEREPMSNVRRVTAAHLSHAWNTIPHVTNYDKADVTELEKIRKQLGPRAEAAGGKLTITAIALKFIAVALQKFPQFNVSIDSGTNEVVYKKYYHIGVAVDTEHGLLVPVIRDVEKKNIIELAVELGKISERARNRKLGIDEMQGGTFTITNLGGIGGTHFSPIVNSPEAAILGIARGSIEPVFIDEQFQPRLMLPLSLSYDHRLIDGADAARFLRWLVEAFQQPFLVTLEG